MSKILSFAALDFKTIRPYMKLRLWAGMLIIPIFVALSTKSVAAASVSGAFVGSNLSQF